MERVLNARQEYDRFVEGHFSEADVYTSMGTYSCPHFGPWAQSLVGEDGLTDEQRAAVHLQGHQVTDRTAQVLALLRQAGIPVAWVDTVELVAGPEEDHNLRKAVFALYGEIGRRLQEPSFTQESARELAFLVEGTLALEALTMDGGNYVPMGDVTMWWPLYMSQVTAHLTAQDLRELSEVAGGASDTETLSPTTPPERLAEIYTRGGWSAPSANPSLPADVVNAHLEDNWDLLFHPNADVEASWLVLRGILENGEAEDFMGGSAREFENMRDDNWVMFADFYRRGPHSSVLRGRMKTWLVENVEDDDEREELLEELELDQEFVTTAEGDSDDDVL